MAFASRSTFQLSALALALASIGAPAAPINWATDTSGNWSLPVNWTPLGLPDSSSDVTIVVTGAKTITHDVGNDTINSLSFNASAPNANALLNVTSGSSLTVNAGGTNGSVIRANAATVTFNGGTLLNKGTLSATNNGTVNVNGTTVQGGFLTTASGGAIVIAGNAFIDGLTNGTVTNSGVLTEADNQTTYIAGNIVNNGTITVGTNSDLRIQGTNNATISGTGSIVLTAGNSRLYGDNANDILTLGAGQILQGQGNLGLNQTIIRNAGIITANVSGGTLTVDPTDGEGNFINTGTMRAENGGTLQLLTGNYTNTGATITASNGSALVVNNSAQVAGGTVSTTGSGTATFYNSSLIDGSSHGAITLTGNVAVGDNQTIFAVGNVNDNTLTIGTNADLRIAGVGTTLTLANNGTTTLVAGNSRIFGDNSGNTLVNTSGNTIQGQGQIGINQTVISNAGLITANVANGTLTLDPTDGQGNFINTGALRAENGGNLQLLYGTYDNGAGTITARAASTVTVTNSAIVQGGTLATVADGAFNFYNSAVMDGSTKGVLTLGGNVNIADNQTIYALGTIVDNHLTVGTNADFRLQGTNNLTLTGGTTTLVAGNSRIFGDDGNDRLTNTANNTIQGQGQIGINQLFVTNAGLITSNVNGGTIILDPSDGTSTSGGLTNTGTLRAENGGALQFNFGHYNNAAGTIAALAGSTVNLNNAIIEGGLLTTSGTGVINVANGTTLDGTAHGAITSVGNLVIAVNQTNYATGSIVNNGTVTQQANTDFRIAGTSNLTLSGTGTYTMTAGNARIFGDDGNDTLTNGAGHTINGFGQIGINQLQVTNAGNINANASGQSLLLNTTSAVVNQSTGVLQASNGGTLYIDKAVTGTGTIRTDSGGTVQLNQAAQTGQLINNANLSIGANNVTVSADYNNANFGIGNAFNKRSNVSGTGQILASGDVAQAITGANVTNGTSGAPTLTIGNVRVGGTTYNYQVANTGTNGPAIRGALETSVNGGNISDSRLSGSGVTAGNYGPVAAGSNSGNLGVTFTVASAGTLAPLANQSVHVANNFDNLSEQTLNIALASGAAAYNAAIGSATPTPVTFGNVRVGTADSQTFTVRNTQTAGSFSEDLNAAFGASSGATASGSITGLVAGGTNSSALSASLNTSTAGAKTGSVTINYATAGTVNGVSNGLGTLGVGSQTIALSGNVYNAAVGATTPSPVTIANQRVGGTNSGALTVSNTAATGNFSEALNAGFSATTGGATSNGGSFTNLAAGGSNNGSLAVGVNTATSGAKTGSVTIAYQTDGTGSNGHSELTAIGAGSQTIGVSGNVYQTAAGNIVTTPFSFGTVQVGQVVSQNIAIQNTATGASGFVEDLNASFGAATGTGANRLTGSGSVNGLVAGGTSNALAVGVNTSSAGTVNASIAVNYFSAGTVGGVSNGLGTLAVGSQGYGVTGTITGTANVVDQAAPVINNSPIALGNVRIGSTSPTGLVSVTNQATGNQQAALNASISGNGGITAAGSFNLLAPGATNNTSLAVGLNTSVAGNQSGNATIAFVSDASNIGGCGTSCQMSIGSQNVAVTGAVYRLANPDATPATVTVAGRVGSAAPTTALTITNQSPDIYTEGLTVSRGATSSGFTSTGGITNLAAGGTSNAIGVTLNTATAGTFSGTQALNYVSTGAGTTGAADLAIGSGSVTLNGRVYTAAAATNNTPAVNFGIVHVGDTASRSVSVTNSAAVTALNDTLVASASGATGPFSASGNVSGLTAGSTSTALSVGLNTATAGVYSGSAAFSAASHDADLSDAALASLAVSLSGQVNNYASDAFAFAGGAGAFTQVGSTYILDYGTVAQNSGTLSTTLTAANTATGPADSLAGSFQFLDPADFAESGFASFLALAAGQSTGPLTLSFGSMTVGSFMDTIVLHGVGSNASGYEGAIGDIQLVIRGIVSGTVVPPVNGVPEPDSLILLGLGLPLLFLRRGRKTAATVH